jgi:hypothetical protein
MLITITPAALVRVHVACVSGAGLCSLQQALRSRDNAARLFGLAEYVQRTPAPTPERSQHDDKLIALAERGRKLVRRPANSTATGTASPSKEGRTVNWLLWVGLIVATWRVTRLLIKTVSARQDDPGLDHQHVLAR